MNEAPKTIWATSDWGRIDQGKWWDINPGGDSEEYTRTDHIEELEAKLAKCQALMHAGLAEYKRRLVRAVRLIQFLDKEYQHVWGVTAKSEVRTVLAELEGELDD
jgi:hypothetical protein